MRSATHTPKEFFKKMKKKPALQAILDSFEIYTIEQLTNIQGQPKWIRDVLVELKQDELGGIVDEGATSRAEALADMMMNASEQVAEEYIEPQYNVVQWIGSDWLMSCGLTGSMKVEIEYGDYLYIKDVDASIEKFLVIFESANGILSLQEWNRFVQNTTMIGLMTRGEYGALIKENANKKMTKTPDQREEIAKTAGPMSYVNPDDRNKGFEIIRHGITHK